MLRSCRCLWGPPALTIAFDCSQWAYSRALRPTPPAAAWMRSPDRTTSCARVRTTCTVHHVTGSVEACSQLSAVGLRANSRASEIVILARGARPMPNTLSGRLAAVLEAPAISAPEQSLPGGPGSPGYSPSTLSTSRKFSPTARTLSSTSFAEGGDMNAAWLLTTRPLSVPRGK